MLQLSLRPCVAEDEPFLRQLYASTRAAEMQASGWPAERVTAFIAQQFALQHAHYHRHFPAAEFLLIEQAAHRVGRLYLQEQERHIQLIDIALLPQWRGQGIARRLLGDVLARADRGGKSVGLHVEQRNPVAAWYLRLGFVPVGGNGLYVAMQRPAVEGSEEARGLGSRIGAGAPSAKDH